MHMHDDTTTRRLERPNNKPAPATVTGESNGVKALNALDRLTRNSLDLVRYLDRGDPFVDKRLNEMEEDLRSLGAWN